MKEGAPLNGAQTGMVCMPLCPQIRSLLLLGDSLVRHSLRGPRVLPFKIWSWLFVTIPSFTSRLIFQQDYSMGYVVKEGF